MPRLMIPLLFLMAAWSAQAGAHAHLETSEPAEGSVLAVAPRTVRLQFSEAAKVTALTIQSGAETPRKVSVSTAEDAVSHTIALPKLAPGDYTLTWHALSDDGHVTSGTVSFSVRPGTASFASGALGLR